MYQPSFAGCWTLVDRAKQHRDALQEHLKFMIGDERYTAFMSADLDPESGDHVFRVKTVPDLSEVQEQASAIIGDVIGNLRATLDHLAWQLACANTGGNPKWPRRVQFPIEDNPDTFVQRCHDCGPRGWLYEVAARHQTEIKEFQPYLGVNGRPDSWSGPYIHPLALLRNMSDIHKHRNLTTVLFVPNAFVVNVGALDAPMVDIRFGKPGLLELGAEVMRARLSAAIDPHVDMAGHIGPNITLDEQRPILPTLDRIAAYVVGILRKLEPMV